MITGLYGLMGIDALTARGIAWAVAIFVGLFLGSLAVVMVLLVKLPATYFLDSHPREGWGGQHPVVRWAVLVVKNLLGAVLVGVGIVMLVTPGQGVLTMLIGIMLLDFPGKRRLEKKLIGRPTALRAINRLRARFGKPPVILN
ncbi:PGPGW domain-containing protein [Singulisphaera sp. Ch08]|uniref:PGPGW domain-containing protein n=1 Tax=Singulisphaera sp. Ch08 TaxID=3120278 RepID=A0AAU7CEB1_9BACT